MPAVVERAPLPTWMEKTFIRPPPPPPTAGAPLPRTPSGAFARLSAADPAPSAPRPSAPRGESLAGRLPTETQAAFAAFSPMPGPLAEPPRAPRSTTGSLPGARPSAPALELPPATQPEFAALPPPRASPLGAIPPATRPFASFSAPQPLPSPAAAPVPLEPLPTATQPGFGPSEPSLEAPDLGSEDTAKSPAVSAAQPRASSPTGGVLGRIAVVRTGTGEVQHPDPPVPAPIDDSPTELHQRSPLVPVPQAPTPGPADADDGAAEAGALPAATGEAASSSSNSESAARRVRTAARANPQRGGLTRPVILVAALAVGLPVLAGAGWLLVKKLRAPPPPAVVEELPLPPPVPEPPPPVVVVAPPPVPEPPPQPPEPVKQPPPPSARTLGGRPVVLEYEQPPDALPVAGVNPKVIAKAREAHRRGTAKLAAGDRKGAIAAYRAALKIYPAYIGSHRGLGQALAPTVPKEAVKSLKLYLKTVPEAEDAAQMSELIKKLEKKRPGR